MHIAMVVLENSRHEFLKNINTGDTAQQFLLNSGL